MLPTLCVCPMRGTELRDTKMNNSHHGNFLDQCDAAYMAKGLEVHTIASCADFGMYHAEAQVEFGYDRHGDIVDVRISEWSVCDNDGESVAWGTLTESECWDMYHALVAEVEENTPASDDLAFEYRMAEADYEANADYN